MLGQSAGGAGVTFRAFLRWLRSSHRRSKSASVKVEPPSIEVQNVGLDEQDRVIVSHTVIQTWTNILSVAFSAATAIALVILAYFQWQSSERGVAAGLRVVELEYAKSRLTYNVAQRIARNSEFEQIVSRNVDMSLRPMVGQLNVDVRGEASSITIRPDQYFAVVKIIAGPDGITHEEVGCSFKALYYYEYYSPTEFYAPDFLGVPAYSPYFENRRSEPLIIVPTDLSIDIGYVDVFDRQGVDTLLVAAGGAVLIERNSRGRFGPIADISIENGRLRVVKLGAGPSPNSRCDEFLFNSDERPIPRRR